MNHRSTTLPLVIILLLTLTHAVPALGGDVVSLSGNSLFSENDRSIKTKEHESGTPLQICERELSKCQDVIRNGATSLITELQGLKQEVIAARDASSSSRNQLLATILKLGDAEKRVRDLRYDNFDLNSSIQRLETENEFLRQRIELLENSVAEDA